MLNLHTPRQAVDLSHPYISKAYLQKDSTTRKHNEDVLVLEACGLNPDEDFESFDSHLVNILLDLQGLKDEAEKKIGHIDRIDIQTY